MDELVRVQDEIRQGNFVSAETILDTILDRPDEITSHLLFDLTNAYEELFRATDRYEDLIRISRQCVERARHLPDPSSSSQSSGSPTPGLSFRQVSKRAGPTEDHQIEHNNEL